LGRDHQQTDNTRRPHARAISLKMSKSLMGFI
jgi:hypothetical protein